MSEPKTAEVKVVPCEPTEAMLDAAQRAWTPGVSHYEAHAIRYRAMLAASPPAETGEDYEAAWLNAEAQLSEISAALGSGSRFMDPPDGGSVTLAEQVRRMRVALEEAEAQPVSPSEGEAVRWIVKARFICKPGYKSGGGVTIEVDTQTKADSEKARLEALKNVETVTVTPLYTHPASDQSDTERMRALAKAQRVQVDCSAANLIKSGADADMVRICLGHFNDLADQIAALAEKAADQ